MHPKQESYKLISKKQSENPERINYELSNSIDLEIQKARRMIGTIFHRDIRKFKAHFSFPEIRDHTIFNNNHVKAICSHPEKKSFRLIIFPDEILTNSDPLWTNKNDIRYIFEVILRNSDIGIIWEPSDNNYTARVKCKLDDLHLVILDVLMDILFEGPLLYKKPPIQFSQDGQRIPFQMIITGKKVDYLKKYRPKTELADGLYYFPFSSLFRQINIESDNPYLIDELYKFWTKYLVWCAETIIFHKVNNSNDLIMYIPRDVQINRRKISNKFTKCCANDGLYILAILTSSQIKQEQRVKDNLTAVFGNFHKLGSVSILPLVWDHYILRVKHLIFTVSFEKVSNL